MQVTGEFALGYQNIVSSGEMKNAMSVFALRDFYILTEDLNGQYVRKIKLYDEYYDAIGRFIVLNDEWFERSLYIRAFFDHLAKSKSNIRATLQSLINLLVYSNEPDILPDTPYNKPSNLMDSAKRENLKALFAKQQAMRKSQYEAQFDGVQNERPFYAMH